MEHKHKYDKDGKQICCTEEGKINAVADRRLTQELGDKACCAVDAKVNPSKNKNIKRDGHNHADEHTDDDGHDHSIQRKSTFQLFLPAIISFVILMAGLAMDYLIPQSWFNDWLRVGWYAAAYLPVGFPVLKEAFESIRKGDVFSEFFLMSIAKPKRWQPSGQNGSLSPGTAHNL